MRLTRNTIAILALASFAFAFAGETKMGAKHHEAPAAESKEKKDCERCKGCGEGPKKMIAPKVRETGPVMTDQMS